MCCFRSGLRAGICQNSFYDYTLNIMLSPADLPTNEELIDNYGVIGQSKDEFVLSYNYTDQEKNANVLDSVMSFHLSLWSLIPFLVFLFACLMKSIKSRTCPQ